jgi:arylsulfatase A-like enzyme
LTGRSGSRFGVEENGFYASADEIMIPRAIEDSGYTTAMFGKWHCGETDELLPKGRGFDQAYLTSAQDFFMRRTPHPKAWKKGAMPDYGPYVTDAITDMALAFIRKNKEKPFFAYIAHHAPHSPFCSKDSLMQRIVDHAPEYADAFERRKTHQSNRGRKAYYDPPNFDFGNFKGKDLDQELMRLTYLSMLLAVDDGVGKILKTLEDEGLRKKTLIFYLSDNGAALARPNDLGGVNLPLRSGKGSVFDGGIRVPFVISWPGVLEQGVVNTDDVVSSMDIFTTTVELAGGRIPTDRIIDGVYLIPFLTGKKKGNPHEVLFFRRQGDGNFAIRNGDHKLTSVPFTRKLARRGWDLKHYPEGGGFYNIQADVSELIDVSDEFAEKKEATRRLYEQLIRGLPVPLDTIKNR